MKKRMLIGIWMMLGALLLAGGCARMQEPVVPESAGMAIGFNAGITLISEQGTKSTLNTNATFSSGQQFRVYGRRLGEGKNTRVFGNTGTLVEWDGTDWNYSPTSYWYWVNQSNYYDFLAVYPDPDGSGQSQRMTDEAGNDIPGNLAVTKSYSLTDNYDLLMAGTRRSGANPETRTDKVPLVFHHMLSAVKVIVTNESDARSLTLNSIKFDNLIQRAKAKVTIDATGQPEFSWIDTQRKSDEVVVYTNSSDPDLTTSDRTYDPAAYDLFIPADLTVAIDGSLNPTPDKLPHLIINFTPDGDSPIERAIPLTDIQKSRFATDDPLLEWEPGRKYTYNINIRLDGGVLITVITTEWEPVAAETPGLLID